MSKKTLNLELLVSEDFYDRYMSACSNMNPALLGKRLESILEEDLELERFECPHCKKYTIAKEIHYDSYLDELECKKCGKSSDFLKWKELECENV